MKLITNRKLKELYLKAFHQGLQMGHMIGYSEGRKVGTIVAGYDAVKEAEKILKEGK